MVNNRPDNAGTTGPAARDTRGANNTNNGKSKSAGESLKEISLWSALLFSAMVYLA